MRAAELLGIKGGFLTGKPLASFVDDEDRSRVRDRLGRPERLEVPEWRVRLRRHRDGTVPVTMSIGTTRARFRSSGGCCASCRTQAPAMAHPLVAGCPPSLLTRVSPE